MPKTLAFHCAVKIGNQIIIHGGMESPNKSNFDTFVLDLTTRKWTTVTNRPNCEPSRLHQRPICSSWSHNDIPHVVVAIDNAFKNTSCSAILNLKLMEWNTILDDGRQSTLNGGIIR